MFSDDDGAVKKPAGFSIGEPLDLLSVEELAERITRLVAEIVRHREAIAGKQSSRAAADAVFGGGSNPD